MASRLAVDMQLLYRAYGSFEQSAGSRCPVRLRTGRKPWPSGQRPQNLATAAGHQVWRYVSCRCSMHLEIGEDCERAFA
jgi:hypothetical protein